MGIESNKLTLIVSIQGVRVVGDESGSHMTKRYATNTALLAVSFFSGVHVAGWGKSVSLIKGVAVLLDSDGSVVWNHMGGASDTLNASDLIDDLIQK